MAHDAACQRNPAPQRPQLGDRVLASRDDGNSESPNPADPTQKRPGGLIVLQRTDMGQSSYSREEVALLFEATASLLHATDPSRFVDQVYERLAEVLSVELYLHFSVAEDRTHLVLTASAGVTPEQRQNLNRLEFGQAVCGTVAQNREWMLVNEVQASQDPLTDLIRSLGITAYVCHPLMIGDDLLGTLSFGSRVREQWHAGEVELIRAVSDLVASAMARSRNAAERELAEGQRQHAEQALRESEDQYRTLFTSMREGFCIIERTDDEPVDFRYIAVNPAFPAHSGLGDVVDMTVREVVPSEADGWISIYDSVLRTGEPVRLERFLETAQRTLELYAFRVEDRELNRVGVVFSDVTGRHVERARLVASEERLELALAAGGSGAWDWDMVTGESTVSPSYRELMGFGPDVLVTYDIWLNAVHPDDRERARVYGEGVFQSGTDWRLDFRIVHPQRGERWIEAIGRVHRDDSGKPVRFVGVQSDVTERLRTEQALRDASRAKDEFLAVLGHELRNPLAPLVTSAEMLKLARAKPELLDNIQPMMQRQLEHLTRLVDDLLDMSRLTHGHVELQLDSLDLRDAAESAIEQCQPIVEERGHHLDVQMSAQKISMRGDFQRLTQVVSNLLSNAAKYNDPGGRIILRCIREEDEALVSVEDDGFGIPPEHLASLFDMFAQVPEHRQRVGAGGLGIGLAVSRQLVELHGGSLVARSEGPGRGSRFEVRLPLALSGRVIEESNTPQAEVPVDRRRILVVDDNADAAESTCMLLEAHGHRVKSAHSGQAAIEMMKSFQPDFVLLDLGLPGMDGYEVARRIRSDQRGRQPRIIALTGWGQAEDRRRSLDAGCDGHLTKPVDMKHLAATLAD